jgi:hypothetical protein
MSTQMSARCFAQVRCSSRLFMGSTSAPSPRGKAGEAVVCLRPTGAGRRDYGQEHGLDEDGGLENQECSH